MERQTLVLSNGYMPVEICPWQTALTRMFTGRVEVVINYSELLAELSTEQLLTFPHLLSALRQVGSDPSRDGVSLYMPAVVAQRRASQRPKLGPKFCRRNVCARDGSICQYCGNKFAMADLNFDHVLPKSRGGDTSWTNVVMACYRCNSVKADRLPEEAGMRLLKEPRVPHSLPTPFYQRHLSAIPLEWRPFLNADAA